jgi:hypothetical protein
VVSGSSSGEPTLKIKELRSKFRNSFYFRPDLDDLCSF